MDTHVHTLFAYFCLPIIYYHNYIQCFSQTDAMMQCNATGTKSLGKKRCSLHRIWCAQLRFAFYVLYTRENVYTLHSTTCTNGERSFGFNINCQFAEHKLFLLSRSSMQCLKKAQIHCSDVPILYLLRFNFHLAFLHNL